VSQSVPILDTQVLPRSMFRRFRPGRQPAPDPGRGSLRRYL